MHNGQPFRLEDGGPFSFRQGVLHAGGLAVDELAVAAGTPRLPVRARRGGGRLPAAPTRVPPWPDPLLRQGERQPRAAAAAGRHRGRVRRGQRGRAAPGPAGRWPPRPDRVRRGRQDRPGARRCRALWGGAARRVGRRAGGLQAVAAGLGARVRFGLRVNPDVEAGLHPYLRTGHDQAKFGLPAGAAVELYRRVVAGDYPNLDPVGVHVHVGSQLAGPGDPATGARVAPGVLEAGRRFGLPLHRGGRRRRPPGRLRRRAGVAPGRVRRRPRRWSPALAASSRSSPAVPWSPRSWQ